jgi:hypothetical protein
MKLIFFLLLTVSACLITTAQNVGIGTTTPSSRLHLVGNLLQESGTVTLNNPASIIQFQNAGVNKTFMQLSGDNLRLGTNGGNQLGKTIIRMAGADRVLIDSTGNTQILGLQDASLTSDGYITLGSTAGRNMVLDNNEIIVRDNGGTDNLVLQNDGGNVGIGTGSPTATLHVNGSFKITDGTQANRRVLTSDASGNATWENTAFGNNDRIMVRYNGFGLDSLINGANILYDNGTISYNFITTGFTISKSGLYHFEGTASGKGSSIVSTQGITLGSFFTINGNNEIIPLSTSYSELQSQASSSSPVFTVSFKIDIYLSQGTYLIFKMNQRVNGLVYSSSAEPGYISAYLISE